MYSLQDNPAFPGLGFPIRISPGQRLLVTSPKLFADCHVLHQHILSSHPPYTLNALHSLITFNVNNTNVSLYFFIDVNLQL